MPELPHLQIEVDDLVFMHVVHSLADLPHEEDTVALSQGEIVSNHSLEKLSARYTEKRQRERKINALVECCW